MALQLDPPSLHRKEVEAGERFTFGANWRSFLEKLNEERIQRAVDSLRGMLGVDSLRGKRFLDIGSGSGLFSLAARRLGATVHSFDYDPESVACTMYLREHFDGGNTGEWHIEQGSALDSKYIESLGKFDVVYSWGVLHHTGNMNLALENAAIPVQPGGQLFIAIYNDEGRRSRNWKRIKATYCSGPLGKALVKLIYIPYFAIGYLIYGLLKYGNPLHYYFEYGHNRGMSMYHDWIDWLGGYPFEVARPETIFDFYRQRGFIMTRLLTDAGSGCNEFVFQKGRIAFP